MSQAGTHCVDAAAARRCSLRECYHLSLSGEPRCAVPVQPVRQPKRWHHGDTAQCLLTSMPRTVTHQSVFFHTSVLI
eukprot:1752834-Rhodomonas_salina.3